MMPIIPPNHANAIAPFSPLGRRAVGEEDTDLKGRASSLKALEESAESARGENRRSPDERAGEAGEQVRLSHTRPHSVEDQQIAAIEPHAGRQPEQEQLVRALVAELSAGLNDAGNESSDNSRAQQADYTGYGPLKPPNAHQRMARQLNDDTRAELLRQQAQKLLESLHALRAMGRDAEIVATGTDDPNAAQAEAIQAHKEQRELLQRQIGLSRRLIDMGINADPAPAGHRLNQRI